MGCGYSRKKTVSTESLNLDGSISEVEKNVDRKEICKKTSIWSSISILVLILLVFIVIWILIPVSFMLSLPFQTFMVFLPIDSPRNANFDSPEDFGMKGVHNFYIETKDYYDNNTRTDIGAWLILPEDEIDSTTSKDIIDILQNTNRDIVIYLHGVFANRAKALEQYRVLRKHFMIVAIDHRGYGDSGSNVQMSEAGITNDHVQIYDWVRTVNLESHIYYWGHSLGSALSARTLKLLNEQKGVVPTGLILESPFTSIEDVIVNIVIGKLFSWLAYFDDTILRPLDRNGFHFRSKSNILSVDCPVMILHAEDDFIVPYFLGETLAKIASENRENHQGEVLFHGISSDYGLGHNDIVQHPEIGNFITNFKTICRNFNSKT